MENQNKPYIIDETAGTKYICVCNKSQTKPYCDGAHKGTGRTPMRVVIPEDKRCAYCGCGQSNHFPFCDGTHSTLT